MSSGEIFAGDPVWSNTTSQQRNARALDHVRSQDFRVRTKLLLAPFAGAFTCAVDVTIILGAFMLAHWVRFIAPEREAMALGLEQYVRMGLIVSVVTAVLFALHGLYDEDRPLAWPARLHYVISSVSTALVLTVAISFFLGDQRFSRIWFAAGWAFAVAGLVLWRSLAHRLYMAVRDAVSRESRLLIVGANPLGQELACELLGRYRVVGYVDNGSDLEDRADLPLLGPIAELDHIVQANAVDEIIIALPADRREQVNRLIARGFHRRVHIKFLPEMGDLLPRQFEVHQMAGRPYIGFAPVAKVSWLKRLTDLVIGGLILLLLMPLLVALAIAVRLDSPGAIFYRQVRVGKDGRRFRMIKFRSMYRDADRRLEELRAHNEATGPLFKMRDDPRVTPIGRFIRRYSLDELPQLFNVMLGDMSLVGPRPPIPAEVEQYEDWQIGRLRTVPGMTGLWQVSGRSQMPFQDMVRLDLHYIRNWSLSLDLEILVRTIPAVLSSRGAY